MRPFTLSETTLVSREGSHDRLDMLVFSNHRIMTDTPASQNHSPSPLNVMQLALARIPHPASSVER